MKPWIRLVILLFPSLVLAHPPVKPARQAKGAHVAKPVKAVHAAKPQKPGKMVKFDDTRVDGAQEHAQKPIEARQAPDRGSLIQPKKDMRGAILRSGGAQ